MIPDIPRFYTALAEWASCMIFILTLKTRFSGWKLAGVSAGMLALQSCFLVLTGDIGLYLWLPCMAAAILLMIGFVKACIRGSWYDAVYCGLQAFIAAEFVASLEWQIYWFFFHARDTVQARYFTLFVIYALFFAILWKLWRIPSLPDGLLHMKPRELVAVVMIAVSVFTISNLSFLPLRTPFSVSDGTAVATLRTMVDFAGISMIYAYYSQRCELRTRQELSVMQNVLQNQYLQYQQSKESIDLINYKYHDLKHQIAVLRAEEDPQKRRAFLDEMEEEIHRYEAQNKTGNQVVDTILTSKNVTCEQNGISLNCVVDGKLLDFMDTMDICSILGNALDNAIECEKKIENPEKRLIHAAVFSQKNFVILRFENYFEGQLQMKEGLPVTTKTKKKEYHGFGLRSIKYTVAKYDGAVSISQRDSWFELKILIPMGRG